LNLKNIACNLATVRSFFLIYFLILISNHLPTTNPYTFENNTLTVDLHFGNELVAPITFECDGGKIFVESQNPHYLYRLNSDCN